MKADPVPEDENLLALALFEKKRHEKILRLMFVPNLTPACERRFDGLDLFKHIRSAPFCRAIVVGRMTMLKHQNESVCDELEMFEDVEIAVVRGIGFEVILEVLVLGGTNLSHRPMVEHAGQSVSLSRALPILGRL